MTDWWALGILTYEMLCGIPPFYDKNQKQMFNNIVRHDVPWPDQQLHGFSIDPVAMDFVTKILNKNPRKRLGCKGANEVLSHPFLNLSYDDRQLLVTKQIRPPFVPELPDRDMMV